MGQLLDTLAAATPPDLIARLATLFGDTPEATAKALGTAGPLMLAALATKANHGAMDEVMALVPRMLEGGDPIAQLAAAPVESDARTALLAHGRLMSGHLLGSQARPLAAALASFSGARPDTVQTLLDSAGPLAVGALAQAANGAPTAETIARLLVAEKPAILAALPPSLVPLLAPLAAEPTPLHGTSAEAAGAAALNAGRWVPWLIAAVAAIAIIVSFRTFRAQEAQRVAGTAASGPMITEAPVPTDEIALPDGTRLQLRQGTAAHELALFLSGTDQAPREIRFEELAYEGAGQALDQASRQRVLDVARVLAAWPSAKARVETHTDNSGDPAANRELSRARAAGIVSLLAQAGIADNRLESAGLGDTRPIATNDTAEGRAQNRRTVLVITSR